MKALCRSVNPVRWKNCLNCSRNSGRSCQLVFLSLTLASPSPVSRLDRDPGAIALCCSGRWQPFAALHDECTGNSAVGYGLVVVASLAIRWPRANGGPILEWRFWRVHCIPRDHSRLPPTDFHFGRGRQTAATLCRPSPGRITSLLSSNSAKPGKPRQILT